MSNCVAGQSRDRLAYDTGHPQIAPLVRSLNRLKKGREGGSGRRSAALWRHVRSAQLLSLQLGHQSQYSGTGLKIELYGAAVLAWA